MRPALFGFGGSSDRIEALGSWGQLAPVDVAPRRHGGWTGGPGPDRRTSAVRSETALAMQRRV